MNIEVPFDELAPNFDRAYRKLAQQVRIPGFRPGKAPARVLESRIGRGAVLDEVVNEAVPAMYAEAVSSGEVHVLGQPDIEVTKIDDGDLLAFTAEVDVRPEMRLPDPAEISVTVDALETTDEEVQEQLEGLRARFAVLTEVDRPGGTGDYVIMDLEAVVDGEPVPDGTANGFSYEIGSGGLLEGLDEAVTGMSAGETKTFTSQLVAGQLEGVESEVTVTVTAVKERELPDADDEFAQLASEFDTLDELRDDLRAGLLKRKEIAQASQARDEVLEAFVSAIEVPLPEKIVEAEVEVRVHDALHALDHDEEQLGHLLEEQGRTREEFDAEARSDAERAVKAQLILDAVADEQQVVVSEQELTERVIYQAQRFGITPEEYVQRVQAAGQLGALYADLRRGKALASVVRGAVITDSVGNTVDIAAIFGDNEDDAAEGASDEAATDEATEDAAAEDTSAEDAAAEDADSSAEPQPAKA
jgi:trigger factor